MHIRLVPSVHCQSTRPEGQSCNTVRTPGVLHGTIEETHARAWVIVADSQLDAMTAYCALPWVQDIDYDQFDSLTITMED